LSSSTKVYYFALACLDRRSLLVVGAPRLSLIAARALHSHLMTCLEHVERSMDSHIEAKRQQKEHEQQERRRQRRQEKRAEKELKQLGKRRKGSTSGVHAMAMRRRKSTCM
jgi:hypothetical protein